MDRCRKYFLHQPRQGVDGVCRQGFESLTVIGRILLLHVFFVHVVGISSSIQFFLGHGERAQRAGSDPSGSRWTVDVFSKLRALTLFEVAFNVQHMQPL